MAASCSDYVMLRGGLALPVAAIRLALDLERRGATLTHTDGDGLVVAPREELTEEDRAAIRRWKWHLLAIVNYKPDEVS